MRWRLAFSRNWDSDSKRVTHHLRHSGAVEETTDLIASQRSRAKRVSGTGIPDDEVIPAGRPGLLRRHSSSQGRSEELFESTSDDRERHELRFGALQPLRAMSRWPAMHDPAAQVVGRSDLVEAIPARRSLVAEEVGKTQRHAVAQLVFHVREEHRLSRDHEVDELVFRALSRNTLAEAEEGILQSLALSAGFRLVPELHEKSRVIPPEVIPQRSLLWSSEVGVAASRSILVGEPVCDLGAAEAT